MMIAGGRNIFNSTRLAGILQHQWFSQCWPVLYKSCTRHKM